MKNKIEDLRNILFAQLERLADPDSDLEVETNRATAMIFIAEKLIDSGRIENDFLRTVGSLDDLEDSSFFATKEKGNKRIEEKKIFKHDEEKIR